MNEENQHDISPIDPDLAKLVDELVSKKMDERFEALEARITEAFQRLQYIEPRGVSDRVTIVVFSGDMDKLFGSFVIATGAASMDMDVSMFFTFWGLTALKRQTIYKGKSLSQKMIAAMLPSGPAGVGTSKMNFLGIGAAFFRRMMRKHNVLSVPELIELAREMDIKLVACETSMQLMGINSDELIEGVAFGGVATYLGDASDSKVTLFV